MIYAAIRFVLFRCLTNRIQNIMLEIPAAGPSMETLWRSGHDLDRSGRFSLISFVPTPWILMIKYIGIFTIYCVIIYTLKSTILNLTEVIEKDINIYHIKI